MSPVALFRRARARYPRVTTALVLLLFLAPSLSGIGQRLFTGTHYWFRHYEAVACAGEKAGQNEPLYDLNPVCEGMHAIPYAYIPIVAEAMEEVQASLGPTGATALYGGLFWAAAGFLLYSATFSRRAPGSVLDRAPYLSMHAGYALFWGNIAVLVHGAVAATAILLVEWPWALAGVVALGGIVKPVFLTYAILLLYAPGSPVQRLVRAGAAVLAGLAPTVWFLATGGAEAAQWQSNVTLFVLTVNPGLSFFSWAALLGANTHGLPVMAAYVVYAALLAGGGLAIAEMAMLGRLERAWLGLTVACLLNPRLFGHDVLLLGPGMVVALAAARQRFPRFGGRLYMAVQGICVLVLALSLLGGRLGQNIGTFTFAVALIILGGGSLHAMIRQHGWRLMRAMPGGSFFAPRHSPG